MKYVDVTVIPPVKILFLAYMVAFMRQDAELLKKKFPVEVIDLLGFARSYGQIGKYIISLFTKVIPGIRRNDLLFIWTVDMQAFPIIVLAKLFRKKIVLHISGYEVCGDRAQNYGSQLHPVRGAIVRWCLRVADRVVVMSDAYAHITKLVEPRTKIFTIPGGIDESLFTHPLPEKKERAVLAYMSYSGSEDIKGISVFEQAAKHVPYECRVIKDMNQALLMDILRESKVYCQISFTECFGMTVLEAMACGCVPVVSNRGALPEVVGFSGVIVPYGGIMETAYAINRAMKMSGESARQQAKKFSSDRRLSQLTALIKSIPT